MKKEKLRERIMCIPPHKDITVEELDTFLLNNNFELCRNANSSHPLYKHKKYKEIVASFANPHPRKEVKSSYIRNIQEIINIIDEKDKGT